MSADTLRRAAALMRGRAEAAQKISALSETDWYSGIENLGVDWIEDADHIASWHPAVALAVADLLETAARHSELAIDHVGATDKALTVARAYLGRRRMTAYTCHCGTAVVADAAPSPGEPDICAPCWNATHPHRCDCQTCLDLRDDAAEERAEMDRREREAS